MSSIFFRRIGIENLHYFFPCRQWEGQSHQEVIAFGKTYHMHTTFYFHVQMVHKPTQTITLSRRDLNQQCYLVNSLLTASLVLTNWYQLFMQLIICLKARGFLLDFFCY